jgi:osmotically-inducible protein OsmY
MKKVIFMTVLVVFGLAMFSGCATMTGETAGENIDDSTIHTKATAIVVKDPDAHYFKIDVSVTKGDVVLTGFVNSRDTEDQGNQRCQIREEPLEAGREKVDE